MISDSMIDFSPDSRLLAVVSLENEIYVWEIPELLPSSWISFLENSGRWLDSVVPSWVWTLLVGVLLMVWWLRAAIRRTTGTVVAAEETPLISTESVGR
jgi:hypothetical protein